MNKKADNEPTRDQVWLDFVDRWTNFLGNSIRHVIVNIGSSLFPLSSGAIYAIAVYYVLVAIFNDESGLDDLTSLQGRLALFLAVLVAIGIESVGLRSFKGLFNTYRLGKPLILPVISVGGYMFIGVGTFLASSLDWDHKLFGVSLFLLVAIVYLLFGLEDVIQVEVSEKQAEKALEVHNEQIALEVKKASHEAKLAQQLDLERKQLEHQQAIEMKKLELEEERKRQSAESRKEVKLAKLGTTAVNKQPTGPSLTDISRVVVVYDSFGEDAEIRSKDVEELLGVKRTTSSRVLNLGAKNGIFNSPSRGVYVKNGLNPSELWAKELG